MFQIPIRKLFDLVINSVIIYPANKSMKRVKSIMDFLVRLILFKFYFSKTIRANVFHFSYLFFFCSLRSLSLFFLFLTWEKYIMMKKIRRRKPYRKKIVCSLCYSCSLFIKFLLNDKQISTLEQQTSTSANHPWVRLSVIILTSSNVESIIRFQFL